MIKIFILKNKDDIKKDNYKNNNKKKQYHNKLLSSINIFNIKIILKKDDNKKYKKK